MPLRRKRALDEPRVDVLERQIDHERRTDFARDRAQRVLERCSRLDERRRSTAQSREAGEERTILFGLCGHGNFDLAAYDAYLAGTLEDPEFSEEDLQAALDALPDAPSLA